MNMTSAGQLSFMASLPNSGHVTVIVVGDPAEWAQSGRPFPDASAMAFLSFEEITRSVLDTLRPSVIVSPVLSRSFDCIDLAVHLHWLAFKGSYRAISRDFPNPSVIESEVRACCPRLDFKIILEN